MKYSFILDYDLAVSMPETFVSRLVDLVEHLDDGLVLVVRGDGEHAGDKAEAGAEEGKGNAHDGPLGPTGIGCMLLVGGQLVVLQPVGQAGVARRRRS